MLSIINNFDVLAFMNITSLSRQFFLISYLFYLIYFNNFWSFESAFNFLSSRFCCLAKKTKKNKKTINKTCYNLVTAIYLRFLLFSNGKNERRWLSTILFNVLILYKRRLLLIVIIFCVLLLQQLHDVTKKNCW